MSLTKEALLERAKPRVECVPVDGFGEVWLRSYPQSLLSSRMSQLQKTDGDYDSSLADVITIIDRVMVNETELMFTDADTEIVSALDAERVAPLLFAIAEFDGRDLKKTITDESNDT